MSAEPLYTDKELSWLSFNERVLQEAADKSVPLIERVRFLGIYSSNTDEFYKVRFADVKRRILINEEQGGNDRAKELLSKIQSTKNSEMLLRLTRPRLKKTCITNAWQLYRKLSKSVFHLLKMTNQMLSSKR